jgi:hypothetical protein
MVLIITQILGDDNDRTLNPKSDRTSKTEIAILKSHQNGIAIPEKLTLPKRSPLIITKNDRYSPKIDSPKMIALKSHSDRTFKNQRISLSAVKVIALSKPTAIAILKLNQQEKDDRTTISAIILSNLVLNSCHIVLP